MPARDDPVLGLPALLGRSYLANGSGLKFEIEGGGRGSVYAGVCAFWRQETSGRSVFKGLPMLFGASLSMRHNLVSAPTHEQRTTPQKPTHR